ncbi:MAG: hypothetical protein RLZZ26_457 [Candidatus Parcubacteria bacterium]|jgi:hypothetical protein
MQDVSLKIRALPRDFPGVNALDLLVVYLMGCRRFDQFCCTWRSLENPELFCPFCETERRRRKRKPLVSTHGWLVLENEFPRDDTERMLLIVPNRHLDGPASISSKDWAEIGHLFSYCIRPSRVPGGALLLRYGDPRDHAGTIEHLHYNVIQPVRGGGCSLPIAKTVEGEYGHRADYARLQTFADQVTGRGGVEWLFSPEGIAETQPEIK